ncbi:MAG: hypothetical protein RLZZ546_593 [Bacteroidota bacterium]
MAFLNKNDAVSKLTTAISSSSDPRLQPTIGTPIKSTNLQNYIQNLLDWVFPPNPSLVDLRGKVLGVGRVPLTPITDYSSLEFMTVMPLGGIIMYPLNGINQNVGAGKIRAVLPSSAQLDGFLFLDGLTIDTSVSGNEIFKDLKFMLDGLYGNSSLDNLLKLPNMRRRVPIGFDPTTTSSPTFNNPNVGGSQNILNYAQVSNTGGGANITLTTNQLPNHIHSVNLNTSSNGDHSHGVSGGRFGGDNFMREGGGGANFGFGSFQIGNGSVTIANNGTHTHTVTGNTGATGSGQSHENRMEYMVLNYAIKY